MGFMPQHLADRAEALMGGAAPRRVEPLRGEEIFTGEAADYPRTFEGFFGQVEAVEMLQTKILAAKARNARLDHTLFACGEQGVGKTTLAHVVAYLMGAGLIVTTGKGLSAEEFRTLVMSCD